MKILIVPFFPVLFLRDAFSLCTLRSKTPGMEGNRTRKHMKKKKDDNDDDDDGVCASCGNMKRKQKRKKKSHLERQSFIQLLQS
jgi:hypothetical protein